MEKRIDQLEALVAMQDGTIADLNTEVFRQQQDIAGLRQRIEKLESKLAQLQDPDPVGGNERPPHY